MKFKNYAKFLGVVTLALGITVGCSSTSTNTASTASTASDSQQEAAQLIAEAKSALDTAIKGNYAWRDTGKIIKQAEKALAAGDVAKARALADKALEQSELAKKQSIEQDKAVKERFSKS